MPIGPMDHPRARYSGSAQSVDRPRREWGDEAGVEFRPHDLRHQGADRRPVAELHPLARRRHPHRNAGGRWRRTGRVPQEGGPRAHPDRAHRRTRQYDGLRSPRPRRRAVAFFLCTKIGMHQLIRIGSSALGGTFYSEAEAISALLSAHDLPAQAVVTPRSGVENVGRLEAGEIQFGFIAANWIGRATRGEAPFASPVPIRMAAPMNAGPLFFITRADSGLRMIRDLAGRRIVVGPKDGGMANHATT